MNTTVLSLNGVMVNCRDDLFFAGLDSDDSYTVASELAAAIRAVTGDLRLDVNTPGGDVDALGAVTSALTDWALAHPQNRLELRVGALAASCGAALLVFAPRVNTLVTAHSLSRIMFHGAMVSLDLAGADNCRDAAAMLDNYNITLKQALVSRTRTPPQLVEQWFAASREGWITAAEAMAFGIVDFVISDSEPPAVPRISNLTLTKYRGLLNMPKMKQYNQKPDVQEPEAPPAPETPDVPWDTDEPAAPQPPAEAPEEPQREISAEAPEEPLEPRNDGEPDEVSVLRARLEELAHRVEELTASLAAAQNLNRKLSAGLGTPKSPARPSDFHQAVRDILRAHPRMSYDDAFCQAAEKHKELYNALLSR